MTEGRDGLSALQGGKEGVNGNNNKQREKEGFGTRGSWVSAESEQIAASGFMAVDGKRRWCLTMTEGDLQCPRVAVLRFRDSQRLRRLTEGSRMGLLVDFGDGTRYWSRSYASDGTGFEVKVRFGG
ncbi:hypothetical protein glysoja_033969 [Glycine soja]|uniref:Uncharacterized protein n=1 Tax=Glycine soja TaxID=3848 RepID=A0A0B2QQV5_GLYSO|nr:hypothetical protein JHK87_010655 [Glycine soja]KHN23981.1 hypothetical protein glysoja_033969 [Glycine soja]